MGVGLMAQLNGETFPDQIRNESLSLTPFLHSPLFPQFNRDLLDGVEYTVHRKPAF
jgi:hypothetical protein